MKIISLFFPACISLSIRYSRNKERVWNILLVLLEYGIHVLFNVWISAFIVSFVFNVSNVVVDSLEQFSFFTKYTAVAIIIAVFMPYIEEVAEKYIKIKFNVETKDEKR